MNDLSAYRLLSSETLPARKALSNPREICGLQRERFSTAFGLWPH